MRELRDVLLSMQRYVAEVLGAGWEVRLAQDAGEYVVNTPLALVFLVGNTASTGSALYADVTQPMAVHCYPLPKPTVDASILQALRVEEIMQRAFRLVGVGLGRPLRVPLYDYQDVADPLVADTPVRVSPSDFIRIDGFSTTRLPDPADQRRIRVISQMTARWRRTGRLPSGTQLVAEVGATVKYP